LFNLFDAGQKKLPLSSIAAAIAGVPHVIVERQLALTRFISAMAAVRAALKGQSWPQQVAEEPLSGARIAERRIRNIRALRHRNVDYMPHRRTNQTFTR
jgi:hypothetical protein